MHLSKGFVAVSDELDAVQARPTTRILGYFPGALPDSNETLCMLNRQRELPLPRPTTAPTATSPARSACILTLHFLWQAASSRRRCAARA